MAKNGPFLSLGHNLTQMCFLYQDCVEICTNFFCHGSRYRSIAKSSLNLRKILLDLKLTTKKITVMILCSLKMVKLQIMPDAEILQTRWLIPSALDVTQG